MADPKGGAMVIGDPITPRSAIARRVRSISLAEHLKNPVCRVRIRENSIDPPLRWMPLLPDEHPVPVVLGITDDKATWLFAVRSGNHVSYSVMDADR